MRPGGGPVVEDFGHAPVLVREVVDLFAPVPAGVIVDATVGGAGHAAALLDARNDISLLGVDRDPVAVEVARARLARFGVRAHVAQGVFGELEEVVREALRRFPDDKGDDIVGILFDLGVSSPQLDRPERGFSYRFDAPLDMRMDSGQDLTAAEVVNTYDEKRLSQLIRRYGEERFARSIARRIVEARPLSTTRELVDVIRSAVPARFRRKGNPARLTFQALRMEVNRELPNLASGLDDSVRLVAPGGRVVAIAYHSLEDRMVKERFLDITEVDQLPVVLPGEGPEPDFDRVTRRALKAQADEIDSNPRSRSARLRAVERRRNMVRGSTVQRAG